MIYCNLDNLQSNFSIQEKYFKVIKEFLVNAKNKENGSYDLIDGICAKVMEYYAKDNTGTYESHLKYLDLQYVVSGKEIIYTVDTSKTKLTKEYNKENDIAFYHSDEYDAKSVVYGNNILVLFPTDYHNPGVKADDNLVKKVVIKFPVELL